MNFPSLNIYKHKVMTVIVNVITYLLILLLAQWDELTKDTVQFPLIY